MHTHTQSQPSTYIYAHHPHMHTLIQAYTHHPHPPTPHHHTHPLHSPHTQAQLYSPTFLILLVPSTCSLDSCLLLPCSQDSVDCTTNRSTLANCRVVPHLIFAVHHILSIDTWQYMIYGLGRQHAGLCMWWPTSLYHQSALNDQYQLLGKCLQWHLSSVYRWMYTFTANN